MVGFVGLFAVLVLAFGIRADTKVMPHEEFATAKSLDEAVKIVKSHLERDGKPEYAALLSESRVTETIPIAIKSYELLLIQEEKNNPGSKDYFNKVVKPIFMKIAKEGVWPKGCSFFFFYAVSDKKNGITYPGLGLRLDIDTPEGKIPFKGFALPIIDLYFGRFNH
jgi:hypothetical protein